MFSIESEDDFSSGESSIDASQLLQDTKPIIFGSKEKSDTNSAKMPAQVDLDNRCMENDIHSQRVTSKIANADTDEDFKKRDIHTKTVNPKSTEGGGHDTSKNVKVVLGQSILDWQRHRKEGSMSHQKETTPGVVTICHDNKNPFQTGSKLNIDSSAVKISSAGNDSVTYSGQLVEQNMSSPWVDCVAIFNPKTGTYILEKVDWTSTVRRNNAGKSLKGGTKEAHREQHRATGPRARSSGRLTRKRQNLG